VTDARERARARTRRERRIALGVIVAAVALAGVWLVSGSLGGDGADERAAAQGPPPNQPAQLPGGGRTVLPDHRVVALYGAPQDEQLGALGIGTPEEAAARLKAQAAPYDRPGRPVMPAFELIATIVAADPGTDGKYRFRQTEDTIDTYLAAARKAGALLVLDVQPGLAPFMEEVRWLEPWLREPDVGLALDPEWSMGPGEVPGEVIGSTEAAIVNRVARYVSGIVEEENLPQKLLIVHQFTTGMIHHRRRLEAPPGVALVVNVDGFGNRLNKISKYHLFVRDDGRWFNGFKLFYEEDVNLMRPRGVLRLNPPPDVVIYE
jgi:hypothetical protein